MSRGHPPLQLSTRTLVVSALVVVAVYGVGFARTRHEAERLTQQSGRRRPVDMREVQQVLDVARFATDTGAGPAVAPHVEAVPPLNNSSVAPPTARADVRAAQSPSLPSTVVPAPAMPHGGPSTSATPDASASTPASEQPAPPVATSGEGTAAPAVVPAAAADAAASAPASPAPAAPPVYRDGTFTGWGHCRHGEIQARVVIERGRITDAVITQCLTRYSCDWIAKLPPQVVSRQSEEVDFVSGATESADAFYFAIVEALKQAK